MSDALHAYTAGVDALQSADIDTVPLREGLDAYVAIETGSRRVPMAGYAILARLDREADTGVWGATSPWQALTLLVQTHEAPFTQPTHSFSIELR